MNTDVCTVHTCPILMSCWCMFGPECLMQSGDFVLLAGRPHTDGTHGAARPSLTNTYALSAALFGSPGESSPGDGFLPTAMLLRRSQDRIGACNSTFNGLEICHGHDQQDATPPIAVLKVIKRPSLLLPGEES